MGFCSAEDPAEGDDGSGCKTCRYFWGLDVPITDLIPLEQLQVDAAAKSLRTFKAWVALNTLLKRYEEVIRKRWIKKNVSQKTAILTEAWPGIATTHRPDFEGLRDGCKRHRKRSDKTKVREAHIWPSINLEDLIQPYTLLLYINSRGRNLPFKFAFADSLALHVEAPGRSEVADTYFMQLHGQNTPRSYGSLAVYPDPGLEVEPTSSSGFTPSEVGFNPYEGLQVLEVQARILEFLLRCGRLILRDYCLDRIISIPTKAVPHMSSIMKSSSTITALATEAPYRLPQRLDIKRLLEVVSARRRAAEDHVWALREDPGYFAREMRDWAEHEPSNILDKFKKPHYCVGEPSFWSKVAQKMITHAYGSLIHWDHARKLLNNLRIGEDWFGQQTVSIYFDTLKPYCASFSYFTLTELSLLPRCCSVAAPPRICFAFHGSSLDLYRASNPSLPLPLIDHPITGYEHKAGSHCRNPLCRLRRTHQGDEALAPQ